MKLTKGRVKEIAEYMNGCEETMGLYEKDDSPSSREFCVESRGAYFAAMNIIRTIGLDAQEQVYLKRQELKGLV